MEMGNAFGSGLDFATYINSAMKRDDGMFDNNNGLLWIFLLLLFGWAEMAGTATVEPLLM